MLGSSCLGLLSKYWLPPFLGEKAKPKPGQEAAPLRLGPGHSVEAISFGPKDTTEDHWWFQTFLLLAKSCGPPHHPKVGAPGSRVERCPQAAFFQSPTSNQAGLPSQRLPKNNRQAGVETQGLPSGVTCPLPGTAQHFQGRWPQELHCTETLSGEKRVAPKDPAVQMEEGAALAHTASHAKGGLTMGQV